MFVRHSLVHAQLQVKLGEAAEGLDAVRDVVAAEVHEAFRAEFFDGEGSL